MKHSDQNDRETNGETFHLYDININSLCVLIYLFQNCICPWHINKQILCEIVNTNMKLCIFSVARQPIIWVGT